MTQRYKLPWNEGPRLFRDIYDINSVRQAIRKGNTSQSVTMVNNIQVDPETIRLINDYSEVRGDTGGMDPISAFTKDAFKGMITANTQQKMNQALTEKLGKAKQDIEIITEEKEGFKKDAEELSASIDEDVRVLEKVSGLKRDKGVPRNKYKMMAIEQMKTSGLGEQFVENTLSNVESEFAPALNTLPDGDLKNEVLDLLTRREGESAEDHAKRIVLDRHGVSKKINKFNEDELRDLTMDTKGFSEFSKGFGDDMKDLHGGRFRFASGRNIGDKVKYENMPDFIFFDEKTGELTRTGQLSKMLDPDNLRQSTGSYLSNPDSPINVVADILNETLGEHYRENKKYFANLTVSSPDDPIVGSYLRDVLGRNPDLAQKVGDIKVVKLEFDPRELTAEKFYKNFDRKSVKQLIESYGSKSKPSVEPMTQSKKKK